MIKATCPRCDSEDIGETNKFDLTLIEPTEARHDFECNECDCLFQIVYQPVDTKFIGWRK